MEDRPRNSHFSYIFQDFPWKGDSHLNEADQQSTHPRYLKRGVMKGHGDRTVKQPL